MVRRAVVVGVVLVAVSAWPCDPLPSPAGVLFASPAKGSRDVPLNAEVKLILGGPERDTDHYALRDTGSGEDVAVTVTTLVDTLPGGARVAQANERLVRLRPQVLLQPGHTYALSWRGHEETRFLTGEALDTTPPGAPGAVTSAFSAEESACFGDTRLYALTFAAASDGATPSSQLIYVARLSGPGGTRQAPMLPQRLQLGQENGAGNLLLAEATGLEGTVEALDWAGHAGPPQPMSLSPGLEGTPAARAFRVLPGSWRLPAAAILGLGLLALLGVAAVVLRPRRPART